MPDLPSLYAQALMAIQEGTPSRLPEIAERAGHGLTTGADQATLEEIARWHQEFLEALLELTMQDTEGLSIVPTHDTMSK